MNTVENRSPKKKSKACVRRDRDRMTKFIMKKKEDERERKRLRTRQKKNEEKNSKKIESDTQQQKDIMINEKNLKIKMLERQCMEKLRYIELITNLCEDSLNAKQKKNYVNLNLLKKSRDAIEYFLNERTSIVNLNENLKEEIKQARNEIRKISKKPN